MKRRFLTNILACLALSFGIVGLSACSACNTNGNESNGQSSSNEKVEIPIVIGTEGLKYRRIVGKNEYAVVGIGKAIETDIVIASHVDGMPVTAIADYAFKGCDSLTSITIPDSVTSIGNYAFYYCDELTRVTMGNGVKSIGEYAFSFFEGAVYITDIVAWCNIAFYDEDSNPLSNRFHDVELYLNNKLVTELVIPDGVKSIGDYAFYAFDSLTSVIIPDSVTSIGDKAFDECNNLQYTIKNGGKYLGNPNNLYLYLADTVSTDITNITIDENCKFIGYDAFKNSRSLTSVTIPDSVTSIGERAFYHCSSLTSITIPDGVTGIGYGAFLDCDNLQYTVKDNGKYLGNKHNPYLYLADTVSTDITNITIDENCKFIGSYALEDCDILTSITIPNSVTSIGDFAFYNCTKLTSITIPDSVTSIGMYAFNDCDSLTSVTIPDSVTSIGVRAFSSCGLTSITVDENNPNYKSIDGNLHSKDGKTLIQYAIGEEQAEFSIPNSVDTIGYEAFAGCSNLESIDIPDSVTSIGKYAFWNCDNLTSVTIGNGVMSIGNGAFENCENLRNVYIRDIVAWCNIPLCDGSNNPLLCFNLYLNNELITELVIPDGLTSISRYAFYNCYSLTSLIIPDSVTSIGVGAFNYCSNLTSIKFNGTKEQWNTVEGRDFYFSSSIPATEVVCTDGTVSI